MTDPIADFLTRIKNAYLAHHRQVKAPYSRIKLAIAEVLAKHDYLGKIKVEGEKFAQKQLVVTLRYHQEKPVLTHIKRISKPGVRIYAQKTDIPRPLSGQGLVILSTSKGILTGKQARKQGLGGEVICEAW